MTLKDLPKQYNRLRYHHKPSKFPFNETRVPLLNNDSKRCLKNLASYRHPKPRIPFPKSRSAAVLVALFIGRYGDLYVLLSRRSETLRMFPGDTALPGGRSDAEDATVEDTARREAFEEIGLPRDRNKVPLLCILEPFISSNGLIVTPVIVLILDTTLRPILNDAEVTTLFSHPLASFLTTTPPFPKESETLEVPYYTRTEWSTPAPNDTVWHLYTHQFLTGREAGGVKPVFGLTANIMVEVAAIGYGRKPEFATNPPGAPSRKVRLAWTMLRKPELRDACEREGVKVDWELLERLAGVEGGGEKKKKGRSGWAGKVGLKGSTRRRLSKL